MWKHELAVEERTKMRKLVAILRNVAATAAWTAWVTLLQRSKSERRVMKLIALRIQHGLAAAAFGSWCAMVDFRKRARVVVAHSIVRMQRGLTVAAFSAWQDWNGRRRRQRAVVAHVLERMARGSVDCAFCAWRDCVLEEVTEKRHTHVATTLEDRLSETEGKLKAALLHSEELQARLDQLTNDLQTQVGSLRAQLKSAKRAQKSAEAEEQRIRSLHDTNRHSRLDRSARTVSAQRSAMRARTPKQRRGRSHRDEETQADQLTRIAMSTPVDTAEQRREMMRALSRQRARSGPTSNDRGILSEPLYAADAWY